MRIDSNFLFKKTRLSIPLLYGEVSRAFYKLELVPNFCIWTAVTPERSTLQ